MAEHARTTCFIEVESEEHSLDSLAKMLKHKPARHSYNRGDEVPVRGGKRPSSVWRTRTLRAPNADVDRLVLRTINRTPTVIQAMEGLPDHAKKRVVVGVFSTLATTTARLSARSMDLLSAAGLEIVVCVYPVAATATPSARSRRAPARKSTAKE